MAGDDLDLLSISHTQPEKFIEGEWVSASQKRDIDAEFEQVEFYKSLDCDNGAPFIFFVDEAGIARVVQGCCNSWTCPRCGHLRALHEYGRMVHGAKTISAAGHDLYFLTLTCRGREMPLEEAEQGYLKWTSTLLNALRMETNRSGKPWFYAQVTERQKRGHPHSHLITTYCPEDGQEFNKGQWLPNGSRAKHDTIYSARLERLAVRAGLGRMCDVSRIISPVAVAVYVAKYMFKEAVTVVWPPHWRRCRYSQNWPKLPHRKAEIAFPLVKLADWRRMESIGRVVHADCDRTREAAYARLITCVV